MANFWERARVSEFEFERERKIYIGNRKREG